MWRLQTLHSDGMEMWKPISEKKLRRIEKRKTNHELFDYVHGVIKGLPIFQKVPSSYLFDIKSNEKADHYRKKANDLFFGSSNFLKSLHSYTGAVALAEPGSESLCHAYSNRSHLLFDHGYYNQCLEDIERALQCKHSENLNQKLLLRRSMAEKRQCNQRSFIYHDVVPEIQNKNKLIDVASNAVAIRTDETLGRHVVAAKNIRIGDVLVVEAPYANVVNPLMTNLHCDECMELCFNTIPCENCTGTLYCSEKCRDQAYKLYHKYECILIHYGLYKKSIFLRITLKALLEYDQFVNDLARTDDKYFQANCYKEIYQLEILRRNLSPVLLFDSTLEPVVFYHYLTTYTNILQDFHNIENIEQVLKDLLLKNYLIWYSNTVFVHKMKEDYTCTSETDIIGSATYAFYSLFKHSCFSNTGPYSYGNKIVVRALTNIKKGEQLTTCFGTLFSCIPKPVRQAHLLQEYNFVCRCIPCVKNWPPIEQIKEGAPIPKKFSNRATNLFQKETIDINHVHKLLTEAYTIFDNMNPTEIPTRNFLLLRTMISDLHLCLGNRAFT